MINDLKRLSVRSVNTDSILKLRVLHVEVRMPMALLIEDGIELLWQSYIDAGYDLPDVE